MRRLIQTNILARAATAIAFVFMIATAAFAHQQPTTLGMLDVEPSAVRLELQIPLSELQLALGHESEPSETEIRAYLEKHISATTDAAAWSVRVGDPKTTDAEQALSGQYREIVATIELIPPAGVSSRRFTLRYDVVMHQVVSHRAVFSVRNDWETGRVGVGGQAEAGVIMVDTASNAIAPLEINLENGGLLHGFKGMIALGMKHISEGTDHLLFLFALLLPAMLTARDGRWREFAGISAGVRKLLGIVTAFTIGHSLTLVAGAFGWLTLPSQPVEILIAISILVSAAHAVKPLFAGREIFIAAGFGLVHGLAFAGGLSELKLSPGYLALSVLGFNVGIELMQVAVMALIMPWLILLARTSVYGFIRFAGAAFAATAATAWIAERVTGSSNPVTDTVSRLALSAHLLIPLLAAVAMAAYVFNSVINKRNPPEGGQA